MFDTDEYRPHKWLDLEKFVKALLTDKYEVVAIKYFTARVAKDADDPDAAIKQQQYLEALKSLGLVEIIEGFYKRFRVKLPFAKEPCRSCGKVKYATVIKTEEKKSDVNLASAMIVDAFEDKADAFVLISGDADQSAPFSIVRHKLKKVTVVFNPHEGECHELRRFSTFCKNIPREPPSQCRLPILSDVALLGMRHLVGADVLIGPQRRTNAHRVVRAFRRDGDIPPYLCDRPSSALR